MFYCFYKITTPEAIQTLFTAKRLGYFQSKAVTCLLFQICVHYWTNNNGWIHEVQLIHSALLTAMDKCGHCEPIVQNRTKYLSMHLYLSFCLKWKGPWNANKSVVVSLCLTWQIERTLHNLLWLKFAKVSQWIATLSSKNVIKSLHTPILHTS